MQKKDLRDVALGTGLVLALPLIGNQISAEVNWGLMDFVIAAFLLMSMGLTYKFLSKKFVGLSYRTAIGTAVGSGLLLIWMNLAVGLMGSENNPANLLYLGVLAVGVIGGMVTRFRPSGMIRVMGAMALAQVLVLVTAVMTGLYHPAADSMAAIIGLNGFFVALFAVSALLFNAAAQKGLPADLNPS